MALTTPPLETLLVNARTYNEFLYPILQAKIEKMTVAELKEQILPAYAQGFLPRGPKVKKDYQHAIHRALTRACYDISGYTKASGYPVSMLPTHGVVSEVLTGK